MQVLIIDNDIAYRNGVSMAASNKHWIPVSCGDIRTAKQIISSTLPDLIISDCLLYGETVIDLLVWMKLQRIDIPVIAVSSSDECPKRSTPGIETRRHVPNGRLLAATCRTHHYEFLYAPQQRGGCQDLLRSRNCFYAFKIFSQCIVGADWKYCVYCYGRKMIDIHSLIFSCGGDMIKERRLKTMRITKEPEVRKQEILDTALKLFGENGYEKTSITDIAKAIGVAQGLCYRYFPSKEALFDSAIEQYADVLVEQFADAETDDRKTLRQIIEEMPATMEKQDTKYYSVFHGTENRKFHDQLALKVCEKLVPLVEKLLQRAKQKGEIHFDDLQAAATFCVYGQLGILLADDLTQEDKSKRIPPAKICQKSAADK